MLETPIVIYEDIASRAGISQDGKCFISLNPDIYDADAINIRFARIPITITERNLKYKAMLQF